MVLTSVTTVAGLTPMLLETSFQGQVLIPMANSLAFGLLVATVLVLVLVPTMYSLYDRWVGPTVDDDSGDDAPTSPSTIRLAQTPASSDKEVSYGAGPR